MHQSSLGVLKTLYYEGVFLCSKSLWKAAFMARLHMDVPESTYFNERKKIWKVCEASHVGRSDSLNFLLGSIECALHFCTKT